MLHYLLNKEFKKRWIQIKIVRSSFFFFFFFFRLLITLIFLKILTVMMYLSFVFLRYRLCELGTLDARSLVIEQRSINVVGRICLSRYIWDYYLCNTRKVVMAKKRRKKEKKNQARQKRKFWIYNQADFLLLLTNNNLILTHCYSFLLKKW